MIKKSKLLKFFVIFCFIGYLCLSGFLIYHATLDGNESSSQSSAVGDELSGIVNDTKGDQTILIEPTSLIIENEIENGKVGKSYQLKCKTLPEDASYKSLVFESSNKEVASVSSKGLIKFLNKGEVEITVYNKDYPTISKKINIVVEKIDLEEFSTTLIKDKEEVEIKEEAYQLKQYETYTIKNEFAPEDASNTKVIYTYDKDYLTISNGQLYAKKPVENLTVSMNCDFRTSFFQVSIEEVIVEVVDLLDFSVSNTKIDMKVNEIVKVSKNPFGVTFNPTNATDQTLMYTSKNSDIVEIKGNSIIAKKPGTATIEIVSNDKEIKKEVEIEVTNIIGLLDEPFNIEQEYARYDEKENVYYIRNGLGGNISCNFIEGSTYTTALYSSNNEKVLLVGNDGQLTPIKVGKSTITITIDDGYSNPLIYEVDIVVEGKPFLEDLSEFYYFVRKSIGHFGAFFVLGGLGGFAFLFTFDKKKWIFSIPLTIGLGFGVASLTEYIQTLVPGRYGCWSDIWLDFSGYMLSTLFVIVVVAIVYLISYMKQRKLN